MRRRFALRLYRDLSRTVERSGTEEPRTYLDHLRLQAWRLRAHLADPHRSFPVFRHPLPARLERPEVDNGGGEGPE